VGMPGEQIAVGKRIAKRKIVLADRPVGGADGPVPNLVSPGDFRGGQQKTVVHRSDGPQPFGCGLRPQAQPVKSQRPP